MVIIVPNLNAWLKVAIGVISHEVVWSKMEVDVRSMIAIYDILVGDLSLRLKDQESIRFLLELKCPFIK